MTYSLIFHTFFSDQFHFSKLVSIDNLIEGVLLIAPTRQIKSPISRLEVLKALVDELIHAVNLKLLHVLSVQFEQANRRFILLDKADVLAEVQLELLLPVNLLFSQSGFPLLHPVPLVLHHSNFVF
jgi:hypothetical protein